MTTPPESSTGGGAGLPVRGNRAVLDAVAAATRIRRGHDRPSLDEAIIRAPLDEPLVERFTREARAVQMNVVPAQTAALRSVVEDLLAPAPGAGILLEPALSERYPSLREIPGVVSHPDEEELFAAAAGVVSVSAAIAETGSIVLVSGADRPRSTALVPITVVAVVGESQIVADLYDWLASLDPLRMPAESVIVTGPSRTADIGMNLVIGVHGPGAVHIVLLTDA